MACPTQWFRHTCTGEADDIGRFTCEIDRLIVLNYQARRPFTPRRDVWPLSFPASFPSAPRLLSVSAGRILSPPGSQGFLKIAKKHDRWIGTTTRPWVLARLSAASFFHERFDKIVSGLSEVYSLLALRSAGPGNDATLWQPPASFARKTDKYWVKPEDVLWLKARSSIPAPAPALSTACAAQQSALLAFLPGSICAFANPALPTTDGAGEAHPHSQLRPPEARPGVLHWPPAAS